MGQLIVCSSALSTIDAVTSRSHDTDMPELLKSVVHCLSETHYTMRDITVHIYNHLSELQQWY